MYLVQTLRGFVPPKMGTSESSTFWLLTPKCTLVNNDDKARNRTAKSLPLLLTIMVSIKATHTLFLTGHFYTQLFADIQWTLDSWPMMTPSVKRGLGVWPSPQNIERSSPCWCAQREERFGILFVACIRSSWTNKQVKWAAIQAKSWVEMLGRKWCACLKQVIPRSGLHVAYVPAQFYLQYCTSKWSEEALCQTGSRIRLMNCFLRGCLECNIYLSVVHWW